MNPAFKIFGNFCHLTHRIFGTACPLILLTLKLLLTCCKTLLSVVWKHFAGLDNNSVLLSTWADYVRRSANGK
jgi:hypothetical protein